MIKNVCDFFSSGAYVHFKDKIALVDREQKFTFEEWDRLSRCFSKVLIDRGIGINQPIAVFLSKSAVELIADVGILYAGCHFSNIDCSQPKQRLSNLITNLSPAFVFAGKQYIELAKECGVDVSLLSCVEDVLDSMDEQDGESLTKLRDKVIDTDPCCIINTSGSTGIPKSCVLSHRGLIDFVLWFDAEYGLGEKKIVGSLSPFHFDGYIPGLFMALYRGATLNVIPSELAMFPVRLAQYLADNRISFIFWVPTVLVNMANADVLRHVALPHLKMVCFAGEVFPTRHYNYWKKNLPTARFINLYGPIEISVICTYYEIKREFSDSEPLPIGFPCKNTDILILNDDNKVCGVGEEGELCVRGSSLALGYLNAPDKTAAAFCQNPINTKYPETIYRTGDIVYINKYGEIMFVGRKDFQIKHQGNRIDLGEIEHFCLQIPVVSNACVLYNKREKSIVLVYESDKEVSTMEIRAELGKNLPKIMWPTQIFRLEKLPRNANGKIDRQMLIAKYGGQS